MSVKREKYWEPAIERERTVSITCDICGVEHKGAYEASEGVEWGKSHNDVDATGVYIKKGYGYSDCGSHETTHYHVCPGCMRKHVMPFVAGLTKNPPSQYEVDW